MTAAEGARKREKELSKEDSIDFLRYMMHQQR
jgi:hypothetical protein